MVLTTIEWTDQVWNPVTGCSKVSPGCAHCYAERIAERFNGTPAFPVGFQVRMIPERLNQPLHWGRGRRVFVNSMSDLFHEYIPDEFIIDVCVTMVKARQHVYQVLTKRAERMRAFLTGPGRDIVGGVLGEHILWGVSVEDRKHGLPRLEHLAEIPAFNRFASFEPLLEDLGPMDRGVLEILDWAIVGGESGPGARPMREEWVVNILHQCREFQIPFFFKQWGGVNKHATGHRQLNGMEYNEFPAVCMRLEGGRRRGRWRAAKQEATGQKGHGLTGRSHARAGGGSEDAEGSAGGSDGAT